MSRVVTIVTMASFNSTGVWHDTPDGHGVVVRHETTAMCLCHEDTWPCLSWLDCYPQTRAMRGFCQLGSMLPGVYQMGPFTESLKFISC